MTMQNVGEARAVVQLLGPVIAIVAAAGVLAAVGMAVKSAQRAEVVTVELERVTNGLGMTFVRLPEGRFVMGAGDGKGPQRPVDVQSFYIATTEVTQAQWEAVMGFNPSVFKDPRRPVDSVTWLQTQSFLEQLNRVEGSNKYRLPSEAEWEYAARAGGEGVYFFGDDAGRLRRYAWFGAKPRSGPRPVASLQPSPWGLYDIHGNVWEWVQECWHADYQGAPSTARVWGGGDCSRRALRGGGWNNQAAQLGAGVRGSYDPGVGDYSHGLRVVYSP